jgi:protein tyrosine kinase modulator
MGNNTDIHKYWSVVRRRIFHIIIPAAFVFSIFVIIAIVLPPIYKSSCTILIEAQEIPRNFVQSTVTGYVEERLHTISRLILSRTRLLEIIYRFDLYPDMKNNYSTEKIIQKMREDILMEPIKANAGSGSTTIAFILSYEGKNPDKVSEVTNVLADSYVNENKKRRDERTRGTFDFLNKRLTELRKEIQQTEEKIADFKDKYMKQLPELIELNLQNMDEVEKDIESKDEMIKSLVKKRIYLENLLSSTDPKIRSENMENQEALKKKELETLRSEYLSLKATLSDGHPDLIALKKKLRAMEAEATPQEKMSASLKQLEEKKKQLSELLSKFSPKHPDVVKLKKEVAFLETEISSHGKKNDDLNVENEKDKNPEYADLENQIDFLNLDIRSEKQQLKLLRNKYEEYKRRVESAPEVELQYLTLQRDYENAQEKYKETKERLMEAQEAISLEESRMAERFKLVDPPIVPKKPYKPNRLAILLLGMVLSAGVGIFFGALTEYMDNSIHHADELEKIAGKTVLAVIPKLETQQNLVVKRWKGLILSAVMTVFIIIAMATLIFYLKN